MDSETLFGPVLGVTPPWQVRRIAFSIETTRWNLCLDFPAGAAGTIKEHWAGVLRWFISNISTGALEGLNSLVQATKTQARGYCTTRNLITMIYLIAGKLRHTLPT